MSNFSILGVGAYTTPGNQHQKESYNSIGYGITRMFQWIGESMWPPYAINSAVVNGVERAFSDALSLRPQHTYGGKIARATAGPNDIITYLHASNRIQALPAASDDFSSASDSSFVSAMSEESNAGFTQ